MNPGCLATVCIMYVDRMRSSIVARDRVLNDRNLQDIKNEGFLDRYNFRSKKFGETKRIQLSYNTYGMTYI